MTVVLARPALLTGTAIGAVSVAAAVALLLVPGHHADLPGYLGMWLVMLLAMMLPTSAPMVLATVRVARGRAAPVAALLGGYLVVWTVAGVGAWALQAAMGPVSGGTGHAGHLPGTPAQHVLAGVVLAAAGIHQIGPFAERCARACRRPASFFARWWTGSWRASARIGVAYGVSCLGCCAALMAVLVLVGMADVGWMLALGVVMAVQKNTRAGPWLAPASGLALLVAAVSTLSGA